MTNTNTNTNNNSSRVRVLSSEIINDDEMLTIEFDGAIIHDWTDAIIAAESNNSNAIINESLDSDSFVALCEDFKKGVAFYEVESQYDYNYFIDRCNAFEFADQKAEHDKDVIVRFFANEFEYDDCCSGYSEKSYAIYRGSKA